MSLANRTSSDSPDEGDSSRSQKSRVRFTGHVLLILGFLWLLASAWLFPVSIMAESSHFTDSLPRKETYNRQELCNAIWDFAGRITQIRPGMITPAILMLVGGVMVGRCSVKHRS